MERKINEACGAQGTSHSYEMLASVPSFQTCLSQGLYTSPLNDLYVQCSVKIKRRTKIVNVCQYTYLLASKPIQKNQYVEYTKIDNEHINK